MRVSTLRGARNIRLEDRPVPTIDAPTDAIIKVIASCICGSDLWAYRGQYDFTESARPRTAAAVFKLRILARGVLNGGSPIGHEVVGIVEEVGAEVLAFKPGDFVIVPFCHCDNTCPHCLAGMTSACANLDATKGGQGEYAKVSHAEGSLVKTDGMPDESMVPSLLALSDVMATGWHAAVASNVRPGATAVVVGDGAVGLCGVIAAARFGAERVIAMSRHEDRQKLAIDFGATDIVSERGPDGEARVMEMTDGVGADSVLECVGTNQSVRTALSIARPGSTVGCVGMPHGVHVPVRQMSARNVGLAGGTAPVRTYLPDLLERTLSGVIDPGRVFDMTLPLDDVAEGYRAMDERRAIKVLLQP